MDATCRPVDLLDQVLNEGHEVSLGRYVQATGGCGSLVKAPALEQARSGALAEHVFKAFSEVSVRLSNTRWMRRADP